LTVDAREALALAQVLGGGVDDWVPIIFPIRWLALVEIRVALAAFADPASTLLLHESQSFSQRSALRMGETYLVTLNLQALSGQPRRIEMIGAATSLAGIVKAELRATLRVLPRGMAA